MVFTYTPGTDLAFVRFLISDIDNQNAIFQDADLNAIVAREPTLKRAAATALDTIATSEALIGKVIRTQDLSTDAAKLADSLRKRAATLRKESDEEDGGTYVDVIDFDPHPNLSKYELSETELP